MSTREDDLNELERLSLELAETKAALGKEQHAHKLERDAREYSWVREGKRVAERDEARRELADLRADLERVTAERDVLRAEGKAWADRYVERGHELAETKASLEEALQCERDAVEYASLSDVHHRELAAARTATAELSQLQRAWALWVLEWRGSIGEPLEGLLEGLPESVAALVRAGSACIKKGASDGE